MKPSQKSYFLRNIPLLISGFIMSFFMYVYVGFENKDEKVIKIPIVFKDKPNNLSIASEIPKFITLRLFGSRKDLISIDYSSLSAILSLKNANEGDNELIPIISGHIPYSVQQTGMNPDRLDLQLEKSSKKYVRIEPEFIGDLEGWNYSIRPRTTLIQGPSSILHDIAVLRTQPLNINSINNRASNTSLESTFEKSVKLNLNISPYIEVDLNREYQVIFRRNDGFVVKNILEPIRLNILNLKEGLNIKNINTLFIKNVQINIPKSKEDNFKLTDLYAFVDLSDIVTEGEFEATVIWNNPGEDINILDYTPKNIIISVILNTASPPLIEEPQPPTPLPDNNLLPDNEDIEKILNPEISDNLEDDST